MGDNSGDEVGEVGFGDASSYRGWLIWLVVSYAGIVIVAQVMGGLALALVALLMSIWYVAAYRYVSRLKHRRIPTALWVMTLFWMIYYPIRLLVIMSNRHSHAVHFITYYATDADLAWVWLVSGAGFAALLVGNALTSFVPVSPLRASTGRGQYQGIALAALVLTLASNYVGSASGLLSNAALLYLFGIGGLAYSDALERRLRLSTLSLLGVAILLGAATSFKELAVLPVVAWIIGYFVGSPRIRWFAVLATALVGLMGYLGVEGQRISGGGNIVSEAWNALTRYDLTLKFQGDHRKNAGEMVTDITSNMSARTSGVEAMLLLRRDVPDRVPYQHGASIFEPAVNMIPGVSRLHTTKFTQLSLGRWYNINFYTSNPQTDPSSQALTLMADFFLNWDVLGIAIGMMFIGAATRLYDMKFPANSGFGVAIFAYVGTAFAGIERNVAYFLVTIGIRLAIIAVVIVILGAAEPRQAGAGDALSPAEGLNGPTPRPRGPGLWGTGDVGR
ncbi:MAG: hypothetical protein F2789_12415 [Actinobacteria bacterium]|nr:hypothetical protein [Actinomycetota bacterium]